MKPGKIEVKFDPKKLEAIMYYLDEKGTTMEAEMDSVMQEFYEKIVPVQVRSFIERKPVAESKKERRRNEAELVSRTHKEARDSEDAKT